MYSVYIWRLDIFSGFLWNINFSDLYQMFNNIQKYPKMPYYVILLPLWKEISLSILICPLQPTRNLPKIIEKSLRVQALNISNFFEITVDPKVISSGPTFGLVLRSQTLWAFGASVAATHIFPLHGPSKNLANWVRLLGQPPSHKNVFKNLGPDPPSLKNWKNLLKNPNY